MLNIALFGPPGAGKGTQSELLIKKYKLFYISTGDLLRREIVEKSKLGMEAQSTISAGGLVSDEIIVQIIEKTITDNFDSEGFLFDGFPRTNIQAYILEGLMLKLNTSLNCLISLNVPEEVSVDRLLKRGITSGRIDDNETVIKNRLKEYREKTVPVLKFYREKGIFYEIDSNKIIEKVNEEIDKIIKNELSKRLVNIVLFGYPGSGRGSLGKAASKNFGLEFIATGDILDNEIKENTEIGHKVKDLYENGLLVGDDIVVPLIEKRLENAGEAKGFIFKGFPRTLVQSYILDGLLRKRGSSITQIIEIEAPMLELIRRLDARSKTDSCMPYDTSASKIVQRLLDHQTKTVPVIEKYNQLHGVTKIDGMGDFEKVYERVSTEIEKAFKSIR